MEGETGASGRRVDRAVTLAPAGVRPVGPVGVPLRSWWFGLRIWGAMMLALYAAFWLQLEGASSAAVCVAILALPTRGQAYQKAVYRVLATVLGVVVSIVLTGLFSQSRDLYVVAFAGWLALCVFAAGFLDGNRAYGAVLSGYTVAVVAVLQIDSPGQVFETGLNRGAAIIVGILALALVNDLFAAPDTHPGVARKIDALSRTVREATLARLRSPGATGDTAAALLLRTIMALHADIASLASESLAGRARSAAARSAVAALVGEVQAARALETTGGSPTDESLRLRLAAALAGGSAEEGHHLRREINARASPGDIAGALAAGTAADLLDQATLAADGLADLEAGRWPERDIGLPIFRSGRAAMRNGLRVLVTVLASGALFVLTGWPQASLAFGLVGVVMALSATTPEPRAFGTAALIAMPLAVAAAGVTEFLVLDGRDQFPLLAIAMAPAVVGACLIVASGRPKLVGIGTLLLVFFPVILSPSNPQSYNPQTYVTTGVLAVAAVVVTAVALNVVLPTSDARRRRWLLDAARRDLRSILDGRPGGLRDPEAMVRNADRIGQLAALSPGDPAAHDADLKAALWMSDLGSAGLRIHARMAGLGRRPDGAPHLADARQALASQDPAALRGAADALAGSALAIDLVGAAMLIEARLARVAAWAEGPA